MDSICKLVISEENGNSKQGTGFFIHPRIILTAAHCIIENNEYCKKIDIFNTNKNTNINSKYPIYNSSEVFSIPQKYLQNNILIYDYGFIILENEPFFSGQIFDLNPLNKKKFNKKITGYPQSDNIPDKSSLITKTFSKTYSRNKQSILLKGKLYNGMSGSPFYSINENMLIANGVYVALHHSNYSFVIRANTNTIISDFELLKTKI